MMNLNKDVIEGKWKEIKGDILKAWGNLTDDELDQAKGDLIGLQGTIQKKYGQSKEEVETKFNSIFSRYSSSEKEPQVRTETDVNKLNS